MRAVPSRRGTGDRDPRRIAGRARSRRTPGPDRRWYRILRLRLRHKRWPRPLLEACHAPAFYWGSVLLGPISQVQMIEHLFIDLQVYYNTGPAATQVRPFLEGPPKERPGSKCPLALNPAGLTAFLPR